jgi:hypothetical protein
MNREVHVRIWERPEVRVLWATRHFEPFPLPTRSAGHAPAGAKTYPKLTSQPDHLLGPVRFGLAGLAEGKSHMKSTSFDKGVVVS